ncbi:MAG: GIY-YIG nuclease family protein [Leptolyngbyaceae cyanobacterium RU_5_1]|nr:GIY-YIG nuclease family protein [Leptolyngbyaceae cyanobacterium RU_5_1]
MTFNNLEPQALAILDSLVSIPFDQCAPVTRDFKAVTANASIYAVRHQDLGLLYVGKTRYTRERFRGGHKAFLWSWLDYYNPDQVRIVFHPLDFLQLQTLSSELEAIIIAAANPPYNARYPARD